jgi:hydrogenase-4 component F
VLLLLVVVPIAMGLAALAVPSARLRPWLVPAGGVLHTALAAIILTTDLGEPMFAGWLAVGALGRVLLGFLSVQYLVCSFYVPAYLAQRPERPNRLFCAALLFLIGTMTLVVVSHHLGLMWVAIETSTLTTAPLIYFNRNPRSLEATWKYLLIGSVGIALALFGSFFLAYAAVHAGLDSSLVFEDLVRDAPRLSKPWLHSAFVVLVVGYGTKVGLAPMHTWKPDAYGESSGLVGALLAGGLTSCAFCALLRFVQICYAAGDGALARQIMLALGLVSMAVAAVFMTRQRDYKRMLAYSSVEHMGIIAFGFGIGGLGTFGALLHLINNGLGKGVMFLTAGNIHRVFGSKTTDGVAGAIRRVPASGALFLAGFFAITASPPFGLFLSELTILRAAFATDHYWEAGVFLALLAIVAMGMGSTVVRVVQGTPPANATDRVREPVLTVAPALCFLVLVLALGVYVPDWVHRALVAATQFIEAGAFMEIRP